MYRRHFILTILLLPLFLTPASVAARLELNSIVGTEGPLIESRLRMEVQTSTNVASALLEFEDPLTPAEILRAESLGVNFVKRGSSIVNVGRIYSAEVRDIASLEAISELGLIRATSGTKQYVPSITSSVPAIGADDVWTNLNKDGGDVNGSGVTVAVLDTGAHWTHPSFWRASPDVYQTIDAGAYYYVDLDGDMFEDPGEGPIQAVVGTVGLEFNYASNYMYINVDDVPNFSYASGDRWIGGIDANDDNVITMEVESVVLLDVPKVAVLYDQENSNVYVRGVNLTQAVAVNDYHGHGTHVASTIAGGQIGMTSYVGIAPGADLIIIRSQLQSADILDAIAFAIENDADIINMSFSSFLGFLDGTDLEDLAVSEAFLRYGVMTVAAAGNLGNKNKHARFSTASGGIGTAMMEVSSPPDYSFLSLLWHSQDNDEHVILTPPGGDPIDLGAFSTIADQSWAIDTDNLSAYVFADVSIRGLNNLIVQISTGDHYWANGVWNVTVTNEGGDIIWVDGFAWDGDWDRTNMRFSSSIDSERTISSPSTSDFAITVTAYSESTSGILGSSSRGPRIDGFPKPTVAAPGDNIQAARDSVIAPLWTSKDGTSMACPHVAGVLALIRQASGQYSAWLDFSALVNGAGGKTSHFESASPLWGHGLTDALWSVTQILDSPSSDGSTSSDWFGVDEFFGDSTDLAINGNLDVVSTKYFLDNDTIGLAVSMRGVPDFQGTDVLTIAWDNDSNVSTGENGADIIVNVTGGSAEVYEWTGSSYNSSSLAAEWWTDSTTVILRMEGVIQGTRGIISVSTHNSSMSNVDVAGPGTLMDVLRPAMENISMEYSDDTMLVHVTTNDRDTQLALQTVGWSVVNGPLTQLNASSRTGASDFTISIPENLLGTNSINSLSVNITSESFTLFLPLILLSAHVGPYLMFASATLDNDVVRVGFLHNELISGEIVLEGFALAYLVYVAFQSETGTWLNFTLSSGTGIYTFEISPSYFQLGSHEVYAIAIGHGVPSTVMNFATLTIVQDYTLLAAVAALVVVGGGVLVIMRRRRGDLD